MTAELLSDDDIFGAAPQLLSDDDIFGASSPGAKPAEPSLWNSLGRGLNRAQQGFTMGMYEAGVYSKEDAAKALARDERDIAQYPMTANEESGRREIADAKGWGQSALAIITNPSAVLGVIGESIPSMAGPLVTAAGGAVAGTMASPGAGTTAGLVAGSGAGSFATEYTSTMLDTLRDAGVDLGDEKAVERALSDPELLSKARERGVQRGIPIAVFDAISFGIAGKIGGMAARGGSILSRAGGQAAEVATQSGLGAAGEAGAQISADGKITNPGDVLMEGAAESVTSLPEIGIGTAREAAARAREAAPVEGVPQGADSADVLYGSDVAAPAPPASNIEASPAVRQPESVSALPDASVAESERPDSPRLTPADRASPLPNDLIDDGKAIIDAVVAGKEPPARAPEAQSATADSIPIMDGLLTDEDLFGIEAPAPSAAPSQPATSEAASVAPSQPDAPTRPPVRRIDVARDTAVTPTGRSVDVTYAVVDAKDLVASQSDDGKTNTDYPAELQPRDRGRMASQVQIDSISKAINPRLLDKSPRASDGAPIVAEDGVVESGNGRVLAIRRAYSQNLPSAQEYRSYLAEQGYPVDDIEQPVLVRVRAATLTPDQRRAFTMEANERDTLGMSATERAMADAQAISPDVLALYRGGDIDTAENRPFVRAFMRDVVAENDRAAMIDKDGALSQEASRRVQTALLAKAYGDADLVAALSESSDSGIKAIGGALNDVAAEWAQMRAEAGAGTINPDTDRTDNLLAAVKMVRRARREGRNVAEYVTQTDILSGNEPADQTTIGFLRMMFRNQSQWIQPYSREKMATALRSYATEARKTSAGVDLLGNAPASPADLLRVAKAKQDEPEQQQAALALVLGPAGNPGEGARAAGGTGAGEGASGSEAGKRGRTAGAGGKAAEDVARPSASWVIRNKATGEVVMETFDRKKVEALNTKKYEAVPIQTYLAGLGKPPSISGTKIDDEWTLFNEASGTLGIPRADMPQIKAEHRGALVNFLAARGIKHEQDSVSPASLKPTQAEFSLKKVEKAKAFKGGDRSILVSADGHVLDGHHQWLAKRETGEDVPIIRLDAPIRQLLDVVREFPSATVSGGVAGDPGVGVPGEPAPDWASRQSAGQSASDSANLFLLDDAGKRGDGKSTGAFRITDRSGGIETEFVLTDAFVARAARVAADLRTDLDRMGLGDVALRVSERISAWIGGQEFQADGRYYRGVIDVALTADDPAAVMSHEAIHAMRKMGLFNQTEWSLLTAKSKRDWMAKYDIAGRYSGFPDWAQIEEGVAHAYADWKAGNLTLDRTMSRLMRKIGQVIKAIGNALRGLGFQTVEDVFRRVDQGDVGRRARPSSEAPGTGSLSLFQSADTMRGEASFKLRRAPKTVAESQDVMQGFLSRGQFVDRAIRVPFDILGGLDASGRWIPGKRVTDRIGRAGMVGTSLGGVIGAGIGQFAGGPVGGAIGAAVGGTVGGYLLGANIPRNGRFGWLHGIAENARQGLIDRYGLDDAYVAADRARANDKRQVMQKAQDILKVLDNAQVGKDEAKVLQAILTGKAVDNADLVKIAVPIRQAIDDLGAEAVSLGLISAESFERNRGAYLHRVYLKNEVDQNGLAGWVSRQMTKRRQRIIGDQMKGRGLFWDVDAARLMRDVPGFKEGRVGTPNLGQKFRVLDEVSDTADMTGAEVEPKALRRVYLFADKPIPERYQGAQWRDRGEWEARKVGKTVTLWRDYTEAERTKMGEIVDARYTIARTFMLMANDLSTGRFYKQVAENENWARQMPPETKWLEASDFKRAWNDPEVAWVRVPDTTIADTGGKKRYGALAGMFVRAEIWRDMNELDIAMNPGAWRAILRQWKANKTSRSPVTHTNNIISNMMFMDLADVRLQDLSRGIRAFMTQNKDYIDARDNGAFGSDMIAQEMRDEVLQPILDDIQKELQGGAANSFLAKAGILGKMADRLWTFAKKADQGMMSAYQAEDEIFRMATYLRRRQLGDDAVAAANNAREQFLDYDIRAPWVNAARNSVFPFISYTYRAVPKLAENLAHRPWKAAKYFALAYAANALAYMWDDDGDDGEERERASLRDEEQGYTWLGVPRMIRMPYRDQNGLPVFLDARRWVPAGDVFDIEQGQSAIPVPAPLQFGGPFLMAFEYALNRQAFTGNDITNDLTDDSADRAEKVGDWLWKSWMPSAPWVPNSWYWTKIGNAISGATDAEGRDYGLPEAALSSIGIKLKPQDVENGIFWQNRDFMKVQQALRAEMRALGRKRERNLISQAEYDKAAAKIMQKVDRLKTEVDDYQKRTVKRD